jgi:nucleotide-binding universal stress UspA family protein
VTGFRRLLVPLDGSREAERVLEYVGRAVRPRRRGDPAAPAQRRRMRPWSRPLACRRPGSLTSRRPAEDVRRRGFVLTSRARLDGRGLQVTTVAAYGRADDVITRCARAMNVELILMSTHARGGLRRVVYGSVADAFVPHATCPVFRLPVREGDARGVSAAPASR